jgi:hypothetical protein
MINRATRFASLAAIIPGYAADEQKKKITLFPALFVITLE